MVRNNSDFDIIKQYRSIASVLIVAVGIVLIMVGFKLMWDQSYARDGVVEKKIARYDRNINQGQAPSAYDFIIRFKDKAGREKKCTATVDKFNWRMIHEGEEVTILYNPNRPERKQLYGIKFKEKTFPYFYLVIVAGAILSAIGWNFLKGEEKSIR